MHKLPTRLLLAASIAACSCATAPDPLEGVPGIDLDLGGRADGWGDGVDPATCPGGAPRLVRGAPATWTVIHYAAGDNDLEESMLRDINEMELGHEGSPNVNIVVQLDRRTVDGVWRYEIRPDSTADDPERNIIVSELVGYSEEEPDSGDIDTFTAFGLWAVTCYPAERYVVIIGGHGKGWSQSEGEEDEASRARSARAVEHGEPLRAIAPDDDSQSEIYIDQLVSALRTIRAATRREEDPSHLNRLVIYGSDACLMGTIEVAYDLRNAVSYLVGSEETEPTAGWPYSTVVRALTHRPTHYAERPEELVAEIVDAYGRSYTPTGAADMVRTNTTIAAIDTDPTIIVRNRVATIAELVLDLVTEDAELGPALRDALVAARATTPTFGRVYTDLGQLLAAFRARLLEAGLIPEHGARWDRDERYRELRNAIDELLDDYWGEFVVASRIGADYPAAMGLSIFMPADPCADGLDLLQYESSEFAQRTAWVDLVRTVVVPAAREARAGGRVDATLDGTSYEGLEARCNLFGQDLVVEPPPMGAPDVPTVFLVMASTASGLTLNGVEVDGRPAGLGFRADGWDLGAEVQGARFLPGLSASGSLSVTLSEGGSGASHELSVAFQCADFAPQCGR